MRILNISGLLVRYKIREDKTKTREEKTREGENSSNKTKNSIKKKNSLSISTLVRSSRIIVIPTSYSTLKDSNPNSLNPKLSALPI